MTYVTTADSPVPESGCRDRQPFSLSMTQYIVIVFQAELLYVMTVGYAAQHIEYVLVHELLIDLAALPVEDMPAFYVALCALNTLLTEKNWCVTVGTLR